DRDRLDTIIGHQLAQSLAYAHLVEWGDDRPVARNPLLDLDHAARVDERCRLVRRVHAEYLVRGYACGPSVASHHRQGVPMSGRGEQPNPSAIALDDQVRPDRRPMAETVGRGS